MTTDGTEQPDPNGPTPEPPRPVEERDETGIVRRRYTLGGGVLQGVMETFDADGMPETRMSFRDGQLHGPALIYQSGRPAVDMVHQDGRLHGPVRSFDPAGRLTAVTGFVDGKRSGETLIFRPEGSLLRRESWLDNQLHGIVEEYQPDGSLLRRSHYVAGILHGEVETFGDEGDGPEMVVFDKGLAQGDVAALAGPEPKPGLRQRLFGWKG